METIRSKDGTPIAYERTGTGPPLVLVHGTSADHTRWPYVLPALAQQFTVYAVDRRGRGGSGDTLPYAIEREYEDILAVVEAIGEPVNLLGHSHGGLCCLGAALLTARVVRLILYEPPYVEPGSAANEGEVAAVRQMQALLATGDREGTITFFLREVVQVSPADLELTRSAPSWANRVAAAHTIPRELAIHNEPTPGLERLHTLTTPTLLLVGGNTPDWLKEPTERLHAILPNSRIAVMPGQQHIAMTTAPDLFVREVVNFLNEPH